MSTAHKILTVFFFLIIPSLAFSDQPLPQKLQDVGIEEKTGSFLPSDLSFTDEEGQKVLLKDFLNKQSKPLILALVYFECPNLCTLVLNSLVDSLKEVNLTVGYDFDVLAISFNPKEKFQLAKEKRNSYLAEYSKTHPTDRGFYFWVGNEQSIKQLTQTLGFKYKWDDEIKQFAHASAIYVLTAKGQISRMFYGLIYPPQDLKLSLVEAGQGKIGSLTDKILLFCYHYDATAKKYVLVAQKIMTIGAAIFLAVLCIFMAISWKKEIQILKKKKATLRSRGKSMLLTTIFFSLPQASTFAPFVDKLYDFIYWVSVVLFVVTMAVMAYFAYKYHEKKSTGEVPYIHGHPLFEWGVSLFLSIVFLVIFFWGLVGFNMFHTFPENAYEINVIGKQWMWNFQYANGKTTTNELYVPKGVPVKLLISSADVIHNFYVPAFRLKHDAVPGRLNKMWFEATQVGSFDIFCTKYCGTAHSDMIAKVIVLEPEQFKAWLNGKDPQKVNLVQAGKQLFEKRNCVACHSLNGTGSKNGPSLTGLYGKQVALASGEKIQADENYIRQSIESPATQIVKGFAPIMPMYQGLLKEEDINALVAYIKSLKE